MKKFKEVLSLRRGSISLAVLILSLFFFVEVIAAAGDIFLPIVYHEFPPTVTPTSTPTLIPGGVVVLNNHTSYTTTTGRLHVVGEVQNNTVYNLRNVKVTANFYNASNQLLESRSVFTHMIDLPAGNTTCFHISLDKPKDFSAYEFPSITYQTDGEPLPDLTIFNIIRGTHPLFKYYYITASVFNNKDVRVYQVKPVGTLYDNSKSKKVIGCEFTLVSGYFLDPGESGSFEMYFFDRDYTDVGDYRLQVDGDIP